MLISMKQSYVIEDFCYNLPEPVQQYFYYVKYQKIIEKPDYKYLKRLFYRTISCLMKEMSLPNIYYVYDWIGQGIIKSSQNKQLTTNYITMKVEDATSEIKESEEPFKDPNYDKLMNNNHIIIDDILENNDENDSDDIANVDLSEEEDDLASVKFEQLQYNTPHTLDDINNPNLTKMAQPKLLNTDCFNEHIEILYSEKKNENQLEDSRNKLQKYPDIIKKTSIVEALSNLEEESEIASHKKTICSKRGKKRKRKEMVKSQIENDLNDSKTRKFGVNPNNSEDQLSEELDYSCSEDEQADGCWFNQLRPPVKLSSLTQNKMSDKADAFGEGISKVSGDDGIFNLSILSDRRTPSQQEKSSGKESNLLSNSKNSSGSNLKKANMELESELHESNIEFNRNNRPQVRNISSKDGFASIENESSLKDTVYPLFQPISVLSKIQVNIMNFSKKQPTLPIQELKSKELSENNKSHSSIENKGIDNIEKIAASIEMTSKKNSLDQSFKKKSLDVGGNPPIPTKRSKSNSSDGRLKFSSNSLDHRDSFQIIQEKFEAKQITPNEKNHRESDQSNNQFELNAIKESKNQKRDFDSKLSEKLSHEEKFPSSRNHNVLDNIQIPRIDSLSQKASTEKKSSSNVSNNLQDLQFQVPRLDSISSKERPSSNLSNKYMVNYLKESEDFVKKDSIDNHLHSVKDKIWYNNTNKNQEVLNTIELKHTQSEKNYSNKPSIEFKNSENSGDIKSDDNYIQKIKPIQVDSSEDLSSISGNLIKRRRTYNNLNNDHHQRLNTQEKSSIAEVDAFEFCKMDSIDPSKYNNMAISPTPSCLLDNICHDGNVFMKIRRGDTINNTINNTLDGDKILRLRDGNSESRTPKSQTPKNSFNKSDKNGHTEYPQAKGFRLSLISQDSKAKRSLTHQTNQTHQRREKRLSTIVSQPENDPYGSSILSLYKDNDISYVDHNRGQLEEISDHSHIDDDAINDHSSQIDHEKVREKFVASSSKYSECKSEELQSQKKYFRRSNTDFPKMIVKMSSSEVYDEDHKQYKLKRSKTSGRVLNINTGEYADSKKSSEQILKQLNNE